MSRTMRRAVRRWNVITDNSDEIRLELAHQTRDGGGHRALRKG